MMAFDSANVQAWSAVAIAALTAVLVGATIFYVKTTGRLRRKLSGRTTWPHKPSSERC